MDTVLHMTWKGSADHSIMLKVCASLSIKNHLNILLFNYSNIIMTEQYEISILEISPQPDGLHSFDWTPVYEWYRPNTVRCLWQLVKIPLSGEFFRREKLHLENEISPETNADSHEFFFSWYCIFHIDVEYFLNVFDVFFLRTETKTIVQYFLYE